MKKNIYIIANWKMNLNLEESSVFMNKLLSLNNEISKNLKIIICPQHLLISNLRNHFNNTNIFLGAQDCHYKENGAFTGDSSIDLIKALNCKYVILGHSERRIYHHETSQVVKKKVDLATCKSVEPILCVGEELKHRISKNYIDVILKQLDDSLPNGIKKIIIAYEPIWSIGSGETPTTQNIEEVAQSIYNFLTNYRKSIDNPKILYGGSVNKDNASAICKIKNINGCLIGGASLIIDEFKEIIRKVNFN